MDISSSFIAHLFFVFVFCSQIESEIPGFKNHEDHWGADILLRDQLKSMRDSNNKRKKRKNDEKDDDEKNE